MKTRSSKMKYKLRLELYIEKNKNKIFNKMYSFENSFTHGDVFVYLQLTITKCFHLTTIEYKFTMSSCGVCICYN